MSILDALKFVKQVNLENLENQVANTVQMKEYLFLCSWNENFLNVF